MVAFVSRLHVCSECRYVISVPRSSNEDNLVHSRSRSPVLYCLNTGELLRGKLSLSYATFIPDVLRTLRVCRCSLRPLLILMTQNTRRARQARFAVVIQAVWRGHRKRAVVAPNLLARRRELMETRRMHEEGRLAACAAAYEAARREAESRRRSEELRQMRYSKCRCEV